MEKLEFIQPSYITVKSTEEELYAINLSKVIYFCICEGLEVSEFKYEDERGFVDTILVYSQECKRLKNFCNIFNIVHIKGNDQDHG